MDQEPRGPGQKCSRASRACRLAGGSSGCGTRRCRSTSAPAAALQNGTWSLRSRWWEICRTISRGTSGGRGPGRGRMTVGRGQDVIEDAPGAVLDRPRKSPTDGAWISGLGLRCEPAPGWRSRPRTGPAPVVRPARRPRPAAPWPFPRRRSRRSRRPSMGTQRRRRGRPPSPRRRSSAVTGVSSITSCWPATTLASATSMPVPWPGSRSMMYGGRLVLHRPRGLGRRSATYSAGRHGDDSGATRTGTPAVRRGRPPGRSCRGRGCLRG